MSRHGTLTADSLPIDLVSAHAMIIAQREALMVAEARASVAESEAKFRALLIEKLKYTIAKLRHEKFGQSSERAAILEQLELSLADLQEDSSEADSIAQLASAQAKVEVRSFERRKPARRPLPEHLPRERIVYPAPAVCPCCGGALHKIGEDVEADMAAIIRQKGAAICWATTYGLPPEHIEYLKSLRLEPGRGLGLVREGAVLWPDRDSEDQIRRFPAGDAQPDTARDRHVPGNLAQR